MGKKIKNTIKKTEASYFKLIDSSEEYSNFDFENLSATLTIELDLPKLSKEEVSEMLFGLKNSSEKVIENEDSITIEVFTESLLNNSIKNNFFEKEIKGLNNIRENYNGDD